MNKYYRIRGEVVYCCDCCMSFFTGKQAFKAHIKNSNCQDYFKDKKLKFLKPIN